MTKLTHSDLILIGSRWLKTVKKMPVVATELTVSGSREIPDVLGFRSTLSILLEAKASRGDFLRDKHKPERNGTLVGLGNYRAYICEPGVIEAEDLPPRWGLLHVINKQVCEIVFPRGNMFVDDSLWQQSDMNAERSFLYSLLIRK